MKVLVIEDAPRLRSSLERGLTAEGFDVASTPSGNEGIRMLSRGGFDAVLLDLTLPDRDGMDVLETLRTAGERAFVLVLSAREGVEPRVAVLQRGADDFMSKPFSFEELCTRLRVLERRLEPDHRGRVVLDALVLDDRARRVRYGGCELALTASEYVVLGYLLRKRGRVLSRDEIWEELRYRYAEYSSNVIEVYISSIRKKLRAVGCPPLIETKHGAGYTIAAPSGT